MKYLKSMKLKAFFKKIKKYDFICVDATHFYTITTDGVSCFIKF